MYELNDKLNFSYNIDYVSDNRGMHEKFPIGFKMYFVHKLPDIVGLKFVGGAIFLIAAPPPDVLLAAVAVGDPIPGLLVVSTTSTGGSTGGGAVIQIGIIQ